MKGSMSIEIIVYIIIGVIILAGLGFAVKEAIGGVKDVECTAGDEYCDGYNPTANIPLPEVPTKTLAGWTPKMVVRLFK